MTQGLRIPPLSHDTFGIAAVLHKSPSRLPLSHFQVVAAQALEVDRDLGGAGWIAPGCWPALR